MATVMSKMGILNGMVFDIAEIGLLLIAILLAMGLHEAMHAFTSHWLGDSTAHEAGRLTLNPLKHIDTLTTVLLPLGLVLLGLQPFFIAKPVPFDPDNVRHEEFGIALVGVAGPLTNLFLAILAAVLLRTVGAPGADLIARFLLIFLQVNIGFFVFNMIPFPPLDGSRLLYAFAPEPLQKVMLTIEAYGFTSILIFMFLLYPVISPITGNVANWLFMTLLR